MRIKTLISVLVTALLILGSMSGCGHKSKNDIANLGFNELATELKAKYAGVEKYEYRDPLYNLPKDYTFQWEDTTWYNDNFASQEAREAVQIFIDSDFVSEVINDGNIDIANNSYSIGPPHEPVFWTDELPIEKPEDYTDWGFASKYWLVENRDLSTGEAYEKPKVTIFTIARELSSPTIKFEQDEKGYAKLTWAEVPGAVTYSLHSMGYSSSEDAAGFQTDSSLLSSGAETTTQDFGERNESLINENRVVNQNNLFWNASDTYDKTFAVMAIDGNKTSAFSNIIKASEVNEALPVRMGVNKDDLEGSGGFLNVTDVESLPTNAYIMMGTGVVVERPIDYTRVELVADGNGVELTAKMYSSDLSVLIDIYNATVQEVEEYLPKLIERQENVTLEKKATIEPEINIPNTPPVEYQQNLSEVERTEPNTGASVDEEIKIYANSAISEYIATNMLNHVENIPVTDIFYEASDSEYLMSAINEAYRQNPLIGLIDDIGVDYSTECLVITYAQSESETREMQKAVLKKVKEITPGIVKSASTDLEKEMAINDYLISTVTYDDAALADAEKNNFESVDKKYDASFTPEGALLNGVGVCASYAGAFKLIAEEAGLDCLVATGMSFGQVPHAWNRVRIDGEWMTVDSTTNDDELYNLIFNVPDDALTGVLVEDNYLVTTSMPDMRGTAEDKEYYRLVNQYASESSLADYLTNQLQSGNENILVRTDYTIDEMKLVEAIQKAIVTVGNRNLKIEPAYILGLLQLKVTY
jgi:hypothetical protein